jgi:hypothetical protein
MNINSAFPSAFPHDDLLNSKPVPLMGPSATQTEPMKSKIVAGPTMGHVAACSAELSERGFFP